MNPYEMAPTRPGAGGSGRLAGVAVLLGLALAGGAYWAFRTHRAEDRRGRVVASAQRFTWGPATGEALSAVNRGEKGEVYLHVTLEDAPLGDELPLACTWTAADGSVHHRNRWKTRPIERTPWVTHCKDRIPGDAVAGTWTVAMTLGGRTLAEGKLEVR